MQQNNMTAHSSVISEKCGLWINRIKKNTALKGHSSSCEPNCVFFKLKNFLRVKSSDPCRRQNYGVGTII
jgi:hypothetical protein